MRAHMTIVLRGNSSVSLHQSLAVGERLTTEQVTAIIEKAHENGARLDCSSSGYSI